MLQKLARSSVLLATAVACVAASSALAADVSLVSGLYTKEKNETNGNDTGGQSKIELGARYGDALGGNLGWFGQANIKLRSYDAPSGVDEPDDSTSLALGGGVRYIGKRWNEAAIPFLWALGQYKNDKYATQNGGVWVSHEANGLYYSAGAGIRLTVDPMFFIDVEAPFFESALFANEKQETPGATGATKEEKKRTEVFAQSFGDFNKIQVGVGIKI